MQDLMDLLDLQQEDPEYVPDILPVDAKVSFRGPASKLRDAFVQAAAVIPTKEVIAGTSLMRVDVFPETKSSLAYATLTSTDGDMILTLQVDGISVRLPGAVRLPGKKLSDILKLCPEDEVAIEVVGLSATVRSGRALWTVRLAPESPLSALSGMDGVQTHPLSRLALLRALTVARRAASSSSARASLMQLSVRSGSIIGVDGARVHLQHVPELPLDMDTSIPLRSAEEMIRLLQGSDIQTVEFGSSNTHVVLRVADHSLVTQRLIVPFPDIADQLRAPQLTNQHHLAVDRQALLAAVKRVRVNADPDYQALFLTIQPGAKATDGPTWTLTLAVRDRDGNTAQEALSVSWSGPRGLPPVCVSHKMFYDLLSATEQDFLTLRVGDDSKTVKHPMYVHDSDAGFIGLIQQLNQSLVP